MKEFGAANRSTNASSKTSRLPGTRSFRSDASRGAGSFAPGANASSAAPAPGPETRTTATPLTPRPLDSA